MNDYIRGIVRAKRPLDARTPTQLMLDNAFVNAQTERFYRSHSASKGAKSCSVS